ncbi:DUF2795 domain-containing protein [Methanoculleus frigidifontis]|uniref:DUF2795 domain-containing protein n=1 Tax=Methanoculleus frigidifontis TaxID=2584085 RepID=UPI002658A060|nr:DUF2795 domain-containing protein [Methanoculleus sp. FWC-SCC1]
MADGRSSVILERKTRRTGAEGFMKSEEILGKRVKNAEGHDLGEIASMWVGLLRGRVEYAVLAYRGGEGIGRKLFAVPVEALAYRPGDDIFLVNIDRKVLDSRDGFSEDDWPAEADWGLIASDRPVVPPTRDEALAVESTEAPPPEITTTERMVVSERPPPAGGVVFGQQVEVTAGERPSEAEAVAGERVSAGVAESEEERGSRTVVEQEQPRGPLRVGRRTAGGRQVSDSEFFGYLAGTEYPAGKHDLLSRATTKNAPEDVIELLDRFETKNYASAADVRDELERVR